MKIVGKTITCWFSCGVASAVAAKKTIELYGENNRILVVNNPIKEEHEDNKRFLKDVEKWLGVEILSAVNSNYPSCSTVDLWNHRHYMSGPDGAPCTVSLKRHARHEFERKNPTDYLVLGFTSEERDRHERLASEERADLLPVLIDLRITKADCFKIIRDAGIQIPFIYSLGFPNANCIGCVKASSPTYWNLVRKEFPEIFEERAVQSREIGCKLVRVKGKRIYLDKLKPTDTGRPIKSWDCGIFCDKT